MISLPLQYRTCIDHHLRASHLFHHLSRCRCLHHYRAYRNHRPSRHPLHYPRIDRRCHPQNLAGALCPGPSRRTSRLQASFVYIYIGGVSSATGRYVVVNSDPSTYSFTARSFRLPASRVSVSCFDPPVNSKASVPVSSVSPSPQVPPLSKLKNLSSLSFCWSVSRS